MGSDKQREIEAGRSGESSASPEGAGPAGDAQERIAELERALQTSEAFRQLLVEHGSDCHWEVDERHICRYVSERVRALTGHGPEVVVGRSVLELVDYLEGARVFADLAPVFAARRPFYRLETVLPGQGGTPIVVESSAIPLFDAAGVFRGYRGITRDVTDRRQAQQLIQQGEERLRALVQNLSDIIYIFDANARITYASPASERVLGHAPGELVGREARELIHPEDRPRFARSFEEVVEGTNPGTPTEVRARRVDGSYVQLEGVGTNLLAHPGVRGLVITARDISERKRGEEERGRLEVRMREVQRMESLGILAGGIAHDFNNLLTGILGHASLALEDLTEGAAAQESIRLIEQAALRAAKLTEQMLTYSGQGRLEVQPVHLDRVVQEMAQLLEVSVSKKVVLLCDLPPGLPTIEADPAQLRQVIMNLVLNAAEAIGQGGGVVTVRCSAREHDRSELAACILGAELPAGTYVTLEMVDTGEGMGEETRARIFEPFFTSKFTGRGLGLSVVHGIMRGHHGAIEVRSAPGRGSTFRLLFPAMTGLPAPPAHADEPHPPLTPGGTVLVVDDEEVVRILARRMLERAGFQVLVARSGIEAIDIYSRRADEIVLVLLDLTMPDLDGEVTLARLTDIRPDARVLLSSGFSEQDVLARLAGHELAGFIQKPYAYARLVEAVGRALGGRINGAPRRR